MYFQLLLTLAASALAANNVAEKVVYSASGASDVVGNGFGCAHSMFESLRTSSRYDEQRTDWLLSQSPHRAKHLSSAV
jgi:hypothetical protein